MLKTISFFLGITTFLFVCSHNVFGTIIETDEISTIQKFVTADSIVLFNVTGTLYQPSSTLTDNQWRIYFAERVHALVPNKVVADRLINKVKNKIVTQLPKKAVEDYTSQLIANLQNQQFPVLGITQKQMTTSYSDNFGLITSQHLLNMGINLERTLSYLNIRKDCDDSNYSFAFGLIFTNKKPVGPAILSFIDRLAYKPEKIIMVDNSRHNLENAEATLASKKVNFQGFWYRRADSSKIKFDPILGNIQFIAFIEKGEIISDEEAMQIRQMNSNVDYSMLLDRFILTTLSLDKCEACKSSSLFSKQVN